MELRIMRKLLRTPQSRSLYILLAFIAVTALPSASAQTNNPLVGALTATPSTFVTSITSLATPSTPSNGVGISDAPGTSLLTRPSAIDNAPNTAPAATSDTPPNFDQGTDDNDGHDGLLNYYFVFLALFIVLGFLGAYFLNRRRLRLKQSQLERGQHALRSDIEGSGNVSNATRWCRREESRRVEGLNEQGEAPPAYAKEAKGSVVDGVAIPMNAVMRDREGEDRKPPEYQVAIQAIAAEASRRSARDQ
jgi:hypothetical protein